MSRRFAFHKPKLAKGGPKLQQGYNAREKGSSCDVCLDVWSRVQTCVLSRSRHVLVLLSPLCRDIHWNNFSSTALHSCKSVLTSLHFFFILLKYMHTKHWKRLHDLVDDSLVYKDLNSANVIKFIYEIIQIRINRHAKA
ncbi:unnamed protein product [Ixodes pacificus]